MRHGKKFNHLGRKKPHREAMLANMACSLIEHKRINTTVAKAKALRKYVEPIINRSKDDSTHSRRMVFRYLQSKEAVSELFREVAPKVADRPGGYTRILKTGARLGDAAEMCFIELVDYNENMLKDPKASKKKRSRRGGKKGGEATQAAATTESTETDSIEAKDPAVEDAVIIEETTDQVVEAVAEEVVEAKESASAAEATPDKEVVKAVEETKEEVKAEVEEVKEEAVEEATEVVGSASDEATSDKEVKAEADEAVKTEETFDATEEEAKDKDKGNEEDDGSDSAKASSDEGKKD